jgi:hypothetical protein
MSTDFNDRIVSGDNIEYPPMGTGGVPLPT